MVNFKKSISTIGVDHKDRVVELEGKTIKLQVWDTAGQERFGNVTSSFYRSAHAVVIVYDITNEESFENVKNWIPEINRYANEMVSKIILGNKSDLPDRAVSQDTAEKFASDYGLD